MDTFRIVKHTPAYLIKQDFGVDVTKEDWYTRKDLSFTEEHIVVDPVAFKNFSSIYPKGTMAAAMAKDGYYVFSYTKDSEAKYMIAIHQDNIYIN